jgi:hypothetical protein
MNDNVNDDVNDIMNDIIFSKACNIFNIIENEINTFKYMEINDQIEGIIYYVNNIVNDNFDETLDEEIVKKIYENCHIAYQNVNYPFMKGESELSYLEELREAQTFKMIESVIKDLYEYYEK